VLNESFIGRFDATAVNNIDCIFLKIGDLEINFASVLLNNEQDSVSFVPSGKLAKIPFELALTEIRTTFVTPSHSYFSQLANALFGKKAVMRKIDITIILRYIGIIPFMTLVLRHFSEKKD